MNKVEEMNKVTRATKVLRNCLDKHGLTDWNIGVSRSVKTLGSCNIDSKTINLSSFHIENGTDESVLNTILHEIAHALCPNDGHGEKWKAKAIEIGCDGKRCSSIQVFLKYNFVCDQGCRVSYTKQCKTTDRLNSGSAKCSKHKLFFKSMQSSTDC